MRVLLISANRLSAPYPVFPLGVDHVAGALAPSHEVRVLDLASTSGEGTVERAVGEFGPDVVGLSLRNIDNTDSSAPVSFVGEYVEIASQVRRSTQAPLVLGGSGFTIFPAQLMRLLDADFGIVGEGERMPDLLAALQAGDDPAGVPGVAVRGRPAPRPAPWRGPVRRGPPGLVDGSHYLAIGGMLNLQTRRGCPYRCSYCTYPVIEGCETRLLPPGEVARTARGLQEAGARFLFVADSTFNCHPEHNIAVARAFRREEVAIPWGAFFAPVPVPEDYYRELAESGLTHVEFGTEALSERMLRAYGKPFGVDDVLRGHEAALAAGVNVAHYFMLGGPGEDGATLGETLELAARLRRTVLFFFCGVRIYPGTGLHEVALREGRVHPGDDLLAPVFYEAPGLAGLDVEQAVLERSSGRSNWVVGSGGERTLRIVSRMHARGHAGPLWERLAG